jgi:hypothetical protein
MCITNCDQPGLTERGKISCGSERLVNSVYLRWVTTYNEKERKEWLEFVQTCHQGYHGIINFASNRF